MGVALVHTGRAVKDLSGAVGDDSVSEAEGAGLAFVREGTEEGLSVGDPYGGDPDVRVSGDLGSCYSQYVEGQRDRMRSGGPEVLLAAPGAVYVHAA